MGIYPLRSAIGLGRTDEQVVGRMHDQVYEEGEFGGECFPEQLMERLQEVTAVKQALEKELLAHRKQENGLRKNLVNYRLLADSTPAFIIVIQQGRASLLNPYSHAFAGYTAEEMEKVNLWRIIHPDWREIVREQCNAHFCGRVSGSTFFIKVISKAGQERWMELEIRTVTYEGKLAMLVVPRDISEFKQVEEKLLSLLRQKEEEIQAQTGHFQVQKMEAVGKLAGGVAHELNNQLTVIYACVDLYLRRLSRDDGMRRSLLRIRKSAQICAGLTRQLLLFGGKIPLFKAPTDLNQVVARLMQVLPYLMGTRRARVPAGCPGPGAAPGSRGPGRPRRGARPDAAVRIKLETSPHLGMVNADAATIERAIINLVLNAREAMPGGGTLAIKTQGVSRDQAGEMGAPGRFACISVSDTGAGIDEADIPHIFEPFFTTKGQRSTGLGLSEAYGIIKAHNGWIEVDSAPGQGSTFRIYLPALA